MYDLRHQRMKKHLMNSPLEMVVQDKKFNAILEEMRNNIDHAGEFHIPKEDVCHVREIFQTAINAGESGLYHLAQELADQLMGYPPALFLEVWGRCPQRGHNKEIHKTQTKLAGTFNSLTNQGDSDRALLHAPFCWCGGKTVSIASFVKAIAERENPFGVRLISSRIKTPSNIAYKVADILLDIDKMFRRDKVLNHYSQVVKDVYGLKIVTRDLDSLKITTHWFGDVFRGNLLEMKDYLGPRKKKSGFEAMKLVIQRNRQVYELQLQTDAMLERETLGFRENHQTYKERQMRLRARLGKQYEEVHKILEVLFCSDGTNCQELRLNTHGVKGETDTKDATVACEQAR